MTQLKLSLFGGCALFGLALASHGAGHPPPGTPPSQKPATPHGAKPLGGGAKHIDLVLALDTSSSMNGLVDGARNQLWDTVNLIAQSPSKPTLRVGLISYGNTGYDPKAGWVRVESDLTTDLDGLYQKLFALTIHGGDEYVARALTVATDQMSWTSEPNSRRIFIVAGNEEATQDPKIRIEAAVDRAKGKQIETHAIYCGSAKSGDSGGWVALAQRGGGQFAAIDHNSAVAVATPMDSELSRLSQQLNQTYVPYGSAGQEKKQNQAKQDQNASSLGVAASATRAVAKSTALYDNSGWDLVDVAKRGKLASVPESDLPQEMRAMSPKDRQAYIDKRVAERARIQAQIDELGKKRSEHVRKVKAESPRPAAANLDDAMQKVF